MATLKPMRLSQFTARVRRAVFAGITSSAKVVQNEAKKTIRSGGGRFTPSAPGSPPNSKRGQLRNSIVTSPNEQTLRVRVGTKLPYGVALELGWIIKPRKTKTLPVPINDAAKRMNEIRGTTSLRAFNMRYFKPRGKPHGFLIGNDTVGTQSYYTDASGKRRMQRNEKVPVFVLVPKVVLKARPFMEPAFRKSKPEMANAFFVSANKAGASAGIFFQRNGVA